MKSRSIIPNAITLFALVLFPALFAEAQNEPEDAMQPTPRERSERVRPNLMSELDLTPEQVRQVRQINQDTRPLMDAAQRRLREANRNLDISIYSEGARQSDVEQRVADFQAAHAEIAKLRFMKEFAVRKILTPEQLARFRELRQRFSESRENLQERRRGNNKNRLLRRMDRRPGPVVND